MRWRKLGLVYRPSGEFAWAKQYAHVPTPIFLESGVIRVYFAGLDAEKFGRVGFVDLDPNDPTRILRETTEPVFDLGPHGAFDDSGVVPSCVVTIGGRQMLYYTGWQRCERVPYMLYTGLAEIMEEGQCRRVLNVPVLDRTNAEPFLRSAPMVMKDTERFRAWYCSATGWTQVNGKPYPTYVIRHAESADGVQWSDGGPICIPLEENEYGLARPWVVRDPDCYRMWYSIRSHSQPYRMGYAQSVDGEDWTRMDDRVGIAASESGWDSEMICYPAILDVTGQRLMFYNGNRHGESGFGVAVLEQD